MPSWLERWDKRQRDLAQGADADLIRANRRRFRLAFGMIGVGFALGAFGGRLHLLDTFHTALRVIAAACVGVGFVLGQWARSERTFLNEPDPDGPTSVFRDTEDQR